jgi:hypothetical protein
VGEQHDTITFLHTLMVKTCCKAIHAIAQLLPGERLFVQAQRRFPGIVRASAATASR